ncbi:MAG TPA: response regulator [Caulobacteraceae bacterium]|nr:response regulator [Caulobacteraceae bacterium]
MTRAEDLLNGLDRPAAVVDANGAVLCANAAYAPGAADAARIVRLEPGARLQTADGVVWGARALPDGERLILGAPGVGLGVNARERYLAALSHELRTPLNGVLGMTNLLVGTPLNADQATYVQALKTTGAHLLGLVNDVLDLAKLESGQIDLEPAPLDVEVLLQGVCELLSPRAHEKDLDIAWAVSGAAGGWVMGDEGRLRQILFNLAGNAIKFTVKGGVLILAEGAPDDAGQVRLRFSVKDTGPGVPEAERARIFEDYARVPGESARLEGTGLGLAIVRRLAAAHDGAIGLDCPSEGGAEFWFEAAFPPAAGPARRQPLKGLTVRIVSPSATVRAAAALQVEACGGRALAAETLSARAGAGGDVLLLDRPALDRPGGDSVPSGAPALVLIAPEQRGEIERLRARGFAGYLIKPLRRASLADRILAVVGAAGPERAAPTRPVEDERLAAACAVGARVLLAEDNPINALLARTLLERQGCVVDWVANGLDAVEAGRSGAHDLILMDQRMPRMDGARAARALREAGVGTPIVALTADAFEDDRKACLAAGMDDFLAKPLDVAALRAILSRWTHAQPFTSDQPKDKLAS